MHLDLRPQSDMEWPEIIMIMLEGIRRGKKGEIKDTKYTKGAIKYKKVQKSINRSQIVPYGIIRYKSVQKRTKR